MPPFTKVGISSVLSQMIEDLGSGNTMKCIKNITRCALVQLLKLSLVLRNSSPNLYTPVTGGLVIYSQL